MRFCCSAGKKQVYSFGSTAIKRQLGHRVRGQLPHSEAFHPENHYLYAKSKGGFAPSEPHLEASVKNRMVVVGRFMEYTGPTVAIRH